MRSPLSRAQRWASMDSGPRAPSTGVIRSNARSLTQFQGTSALPTRCPSPGLLTCVRREGGEPGGPLGRGRRWGRHAGGCGAGLSLHLCGRVGHCCCLVLPVHCGWPRGHRGGEKKRGTVKRAEGTRGTHASADLRPWRQGGSWLCAELVPSPGPSVPPDKPQLCSQVADIPPTWAQTAGVHQPISAGLEGGAGRILGQSERDWGPSGGWLWGGLG